MFLILINTGYNNFCYSERVPELYNACLYCAVSVNSPSSVPLWCPNELKRSSRDITELDVVLAEFEKIAANYR